MYSCEKKTEKKEWCLCEREQKNEKVCLTADIVLEDKALCEDKLLFSKYTHITQCRAGQHTQKIKSTNNRKAKPKLIYEEQLIIFKIYAF